MPETITYKYKCGCSATGNHNTPKHCIAHGKPGEDDTIEALKAQFRAMSLEDRGAFYHRNLDMIEKLEAQGEFSLRDHATPVDQPPPPPPAPPPDPKTPEKQKEPNAKG